MEFIGAELALCVFRFLVLGVFGIICQSPDMELDLYPVHHSCAVYLHDRSGHGPLSGRFIRGRWHVYCRSSGIWWYLSPGMYSVARVPPALRWMTTAVVKVKLHQL